MHSFSKIVGVRTIAIALAMMLTVFGAQSLKAKSNNGSCHSCNTCDQKTHCDSCDQKVHTCNTCQPVKVEPAPCGKCQASCKDQAHARHEASEDQARAERAQKKAADKAAHERAEADAI